MAQSSVGVELGGIREGFAVACGPGFEDRFVDHWEHASGNESPEPKAQVYPILDIGFGLLNGAQGRWPCVLRTILSLGEDVLCGLAVVSAVCDGISALSAQAA